MSVSKTEFMIMITKINKKIVTNPTNPNPNVPKWSSGTDKFRRAHILEKKQNVQAATSMNLTIIDSWNKRPYCTYVTALFVFQATCLQSFALDVHLRCFFDLGITLRNAGACIWPKQYIYLIRAAEFG